jgi:hypothetical protein
MVSAFKERTSTSSVGRHFSMKRENFRNGMGVLHPEVCYWMIVPVRGFSSFSGV